MKPDLNKLEQRTQAGKQLAATACVLAAFLAVSLSAAQTKTEHDELQRRLQAAQSAREAGKPEDVARANALVVAEGLREDAAIEMLTGNAARAAELYNDSLSFEVKTEVYAELAYADAEAKEYDKAITAAEYALKNNPNDLRALRVLASAWTQKNEPAKAEPYFAAIAKAKPEVDNFYPLGVCQLAIKTPESHKRAVESFEQMKKIAGTADRCMC